MNRQYRIKYDDGPADEYEATIIPYRYRVEVKGLLRWHVVKKFEDFDRDYAKFRCEELMAMLETDGSPVELRGEREQRVNRCAKIEQESNTACISFKQMLRELF